MSNEPTRPLPAAPRELIVVARPEAELNVSHGIAESNPDFDVASFDELLASPEMRLTPLFGLSEQRLRLKTFAVAAETGVEVPDLSVFYRLYAPDERLDELAARMREEPAVETAYVKPGAVPAIWFTGNMAADPTPPPVVPDFTPTQRYLNAAPRGIDARFAWTLPGGRGRDVKIIDVEGAWRFTHFDLTQNQGGIVGGTPSDQLLWRNHGTAVIGVFSGDENGKGVMGICPEANVSAVSIFGTPQQGWGSAAAIFWAADRLGPGDILLIELQQPGPAANFEEQDDQFGYIPVEWWPDCLRAIQYATGRGVVVVEAGGNGKQDLGAAIYDQAPAPPHAPFPSWWRNPFRRNPIDTGSIIVGAGAPPAIQGFTSLPDRCRLDFSNFDSSNADSVFDAQGWGALVTTCGFGNTPGGGGPDEDFWFTRSFSGTSSAAPMVAGALGCLQGILKAAGREPLGPSAARELLRNTGSPQGDAPGSPVSNRIGNRPDLRQMVAASLP